MIKQTIIAIALVLSTGVARAQDVTHLIVTSDLLAITTATARDEGFNPGVNGTFLQELRTRDGREPLPGYESIGLYDAGHLARSYAVRIATGDIVDPMRCEIYRFPDLLKFRRSTTEAFASQAASTVKIAAEIGCDDLKVVP